MTYTTPLRQKLALGIDDVKQEGKLARLLDDLKDRILTPVPGDIAWHMAEAELAAPEALAADWQAWPAFGPRSVWSRKQGHTWFAARVTVPAAAAGQTFVLRFTSQWQERPGSTDPQCLAWIDGQIAQAIDGNHNELVIAREAVTGASVVLHVDAFTFFDRPLTGFTVEYLVRDPQIEALYWDLATPFEVARRLHQTDPRRHQIFNRVDAALRALDRRGKGLTAELMASLPAAQEIAAGIYALVDTEVQPVITAFGHTHVDIAWLWRVLHTREKGGRSFATALTMMAEYPQFIFMYNQAVLYHFIKQDYPVLWQGIKDAVRRGQLDIEGAMWVEPDANIVSGESMVRQIMMGRRFHQTEFGVTPTCVWLPDTFGYSANMPQILAKSGLGYFLTSKLSWNDTDRHPYDTFFWRGIDGTETKAHLITAQNFESDEIFTTYNSDMSVSQVMGSWKRYEPKAAHDELVLAYGWGDGGGGPTREMVERATRLERGIPGAPRLRLEGLAPFLARLGAKMTRDAGRFPRWNGELYLQYHRGTLTTVARNKRNNRLAERAMRELEWMLALADVTAGRPCPHDLLDRMWKVVLINQFHDILPGTSIPEVYADSDSEYDALFAEIEGGNGPLLGAAHQLGGGDGAARLHNFTSQPRDGDLVILPDAASGRMLVTGGRAEPVQRLTQADGTSALAAPVHGLGPHGWIGATLAPPAAARDPQGGLTVTPDRLENDHIVLTLDTAGEITSFIDRASGRDLIARGQTANRLVAYEDKSMNWDAWDIDWYFEEQFWPLSGSPAAITVVETGPHRAALRIERRYRASTIVQVVSLERGARMVTFDTFMDWHEQQEVLKAVFPLDMNVSEVRSEIQFGHVTRPTHRNTTWDRARFEASMHRWIDMSEPDFGAALINDCKYAYDAHEQTIRLTLVRGTVHPHPQADQGEHRLRYALMLHDGLRDLDRVHHAAEALNNPVRLIGTPGTGGAAAAFSLVACDAPNVAIETVKKAEDDTGLILRLFEHSNRRASARLTFGIPVAAVYRVSLMEEGAEPVPLAADGSVTLGLCPFEIATLRVIPSGGAVHG
ncbi:MAG: alpha-mannosidase [Rhodobacteraceae bacterium]|nr:alpha-mannosidase [Paracoccaceae bacterium]